MKPIIILPPGSMSKDDIGKLGSNELCVVVAKNPSAVKFLDPIPAAGPRTQIANAAIRLSRILLNGSWGHVTNASCIGVSEISKIFVAALVEGTELDRRGSNQEQEAEIFTWEKREEIKRLARLEAKQEREAAKKELAEKTKGQQATPEKP